MIKLQEDFNPRSRVGSDKSFFADIVDDVKISIHAPAWGATTMLTVPL